MSLVIHMLLTAVAVVWGLSAIAVIVIFAVDERAFRRSTARTDSDGEAIAANRVPTDVRVRIRELASSSAG